MPIFHFCAKGKSAMSSKLFLLYLKFDKDNDIFIVLKNYSNLCNWNEK